MVEAECRRRHSERMGKVILCESKLIVRRALELCQNCSWPRACEPSRSGVLACTGRNGRTVCGVKGACHPSPRRLLRPTATVTVFAVCGGSFGVFSGPLRDRGDAAITLETTGFSALFAFFRRADGGSSNPVGDALFRLGFSAQNRNPSPKVSVFCVPPCVACGPVPRRRRLLKKIQTDPLRSRRGIARPPRGSPRCALDGGRNGGDTVRSKGGQGNSLLARSR